MRKFMFYTLFVIFNIGGLAMLGAAFYTALDPALANSRIFGQDIPPWMGFALLGIFLLSPGFFMVSRKSGFLDRAVEIMRSRGGKNAGQK